MRHGRVVLQRHLDALTLPNVDHRPGRGVAERPRVVADARRDRDDRVRDPEMNVRDRPGRRRRELGGNSGVPHRECVRVGRRDAGVARRRGRRARGRPVRHARHVGHRRARVRRGDLRVVLRLLRRDGEPDGERNHRADRDAHEEREQLQRDDRVALGLRLLAVRRPRRQMGGCWICHVARLRGSSCRTGRYGASERPSSGRSRRAIAGFHGSARTADLLPSCTWPTRFAS